MKTHCYFLIQEVNYPELDDRSIGNILNLHFMQIYEVNSEQNCREF